MQDSEGINQIIKLNTGWKGEMLTDLRSIINSVNSNIVETVKYRKPSKPEGDAFWVLKGDICFVNILKNTVRLNFSKGAKMQPSNLFNTRLDSKVVRAIDFYEGDKIDAQATAKLVSEAVDLNSLSKS